MWSSLGPWSDSKCSKRVEIECSCQDHLDLRSELCQYENDAGWIQEENIIESSHRLSAMQNGQ